jgi:hypothetical protein
MSLNEYAIQIKSITEALKVTPDAQSLTIHRDGTCTLGFDSDAVEMMPAGVADVFSEAWDRYYNYDEDGNKQPMPPTEHFYKLALERSAEIKRGEGIE